VILYDISMTIEPGMAVYKNKAEKNPRLIVTRDFTDSAVYETRLEMDLHTGTHIDMPRHILPAGDSSDHWTAESIFTRCAVLDFSDLESDRITALSLEQKTAELEGAVPLFGRERAVLLKTANSQRESFDFNFTFLEKSGAAYLAEKQTAGVGIDALGIERDQPGHETHRTLLEAGAWILEGLRLAKVPQGFYILALMPLKIAGVEALPARAVLLSPDAIKIS
jgi:arylformamidase